MPRDCLFCGLKAGNKEHLFASWILGKREWGPMRRAIGKLPVKIAGGDVTVGTVCVACNNGWMSTLESQNMALIGALMEGVSVPLDTSQQATLSAWSLKTAMVLDTVNNRGRTAFYEKTECENLRLSSTIPSMTNIWVGRCSVQGLMGNGTDFWTFLADKTKIGRGCATTILIGHLAIQVATIHPFGGPSAGHKIGLRLDQNPARYETWGESTAHDALLPRNRNTPERMMWCIRRASSWCWRRRWPREKL